MHELAVTKNIINIVVDFAEKENAIKVNSINLVIGDLTQIIDDSVQFYFDFLSKGTVCEGAKLVFERIAAVCRCEKCEKEFEFKAGHFECPYCEDGLGILTEKGTEFFIKSIDVD